MDASTVENVNHLLIFAACFVLVVVTIGFVGTFIDKLMKENEQLRAKLARFEQIEQLRKR